MQQQGQNPVHQRVVRQVDHAVPDHEFGWYLLAVLHGGGHEVAPGAGVFWRRHVVVDLDVVRTENHVINLAKTLITRLITLKEQFGGRKQLRR